MSNDEANLPKYQAAWSYIDEAVTELESAQVGLDKKLYRQLQKIIEELDGCRLLLSEQFIEPTEERLAAAKRKRSRKIT